MHGEKEFIERLSKITEDCRIDMHEPDEQGVYATVSGNHLDNAMGDGPPERACGEYIVTLTKEANGKIVDT